MMNDERVRRNWLIFSFHNSGRVYIRRESTAWSIGYVNRYESMKPQTQKKPRYTK
jgi:hypothetical protein